VEALLSDPNREIICDTLMKFSAKAKSFHIAVRVISPLHETLPSRIHTTTCQRAVGNRSSSEESAEP